MESTECHDRQDSGPSSEGSPSSFVTPRRFTAPPTQGLWSTLAGALAAGRPAFAWLHADSQTLALDDAPSALATRRGAAGPWRYLAWRFDAPRPQLSPWQAWPQRIMRAPAAVARWADGQCTAFAQGPFAGWPAQDAPAPTRAQGDVALTADALEGKASWMARVAAAEAACQAGTLHKVVLARATRYAGAMCAVSTLRALHARHPEAIVFCLSHGDAVFLGATPETLVDIADGHLVTHALAGTRRRGRSVAEDRRLAEALQSNVKERWEHAAVVEDVADTLAPLCTTLDWPSTPRVEAGATVQHLETPFHGRLRPEVDALQVAEALHPTAALGGLPRALARAWLTEHEPLDRGFFGAPIGWIDGGVGDEAEGERAHVAVAIRSALITPQAAFTFAGAGIVAGSDPEAEWIETQTKQASVAQALRRIGRS